MPYAVIILRQVKGGEGRFTSDFGCVLNDLSEIKRFNERSLKQANAIFDYHSKQLAWSKAARDRLGIKPSEDAIVWLYDKGEGFELREEIV